MNMNMIMMTYVMNMMMKKMTKVKKHDNNGDIEDENEKKEMNPKETIKMTQQLKR